jgi:hypothetical protein
MTSSVPARAGDTRAGETRAGETRAGETRAGEIGPIRREIIFEPLPDRPAPVEAPPPVPATEPEQPAVPVPT